MELRGLATVTNNSNSVVSAAAVDWSQAKNEKDAGRTVWFRLALVVSAPFYEVAAITYNAGTNKYTATLVGLYTGTTQASVLVLLHYSFLTSGLYIFGDADDPTSVRPGLNRNFARIDVALGGDAGPGRVILFKDSAAIDARMWSLAALSDGTAVLLALADDGTTIQTSFIFKRDGKLQLPSGIIEISNDSALGAGSGSNDKIPTQASVKAYCNTLIAAADAMVFKGLINCSGNPNYPAADAGHTYRVSVAGKIGGGSGPNVEAGDLLICLTDTTAAGNHATVGANWTIAQNNLDGAVIGPASATNDNFAQFNGTTGKLIKGGIAPDTDVTLGADSDTRVATQKAVRALIEAGDAAANANADDRIPQVNIYTDSDLATTNESRVPSVPAVRAAIDASNAVIGTACFDASTGAIANLDARGVIASITYAGVGHYSVTFASNLPDTGYTVDISCEGSSLLSAGVVHQGHRNVDGFDFYIFQFDIHGVNALADVDGIMITVFRLPPS